LQIAFSADTGEGLYGLFIVNRDSTGLVKIDTKTLYQNDWDPQWSPKGNTLAFVSGDQLRRQKDIYVLDLDGEAINLTNTPQIQESSPTWSPDGQWIAFASSRRVEAETHYGIGLMHADGASRRQLIDDAPMLYYDLAWSPDGQWIAAAKQYYVDEYGHYSCTVVLVRVDIR
jgi:Tol biopolymer transport system component